jgi:capsular exopolysaccharide synthesis family protein
VERLFDAPIIGYIFEQENAKDEDNRFYAADDLRPMADAFRALRTNIEISQAGRPLKSLLVTSADIGDGKTSIAANLALSIAQRDKKVVLLDADLRRPSVHEFFELTNDRGLVDLISDGAAISDVVRWKAGKKVTVLTSGNTPPNPTEILSSEKFDRLLSELKDTSDVMIIDGPPFIVTDAMVMASKVDGVLLVVRPGHTRRSLAQGALEQLKLTGTRVVGIVLNRIPLRGADYYAGKSYVYSYYTSDYGQDVDGTGKQADLERLKTNFSPYTHKVTHFVKHLFESVFKLSPK